MLCDILEGLRDVAEYELLQLLCFEDSLVFGEDLVLQLQHHQPIHYRPVFLLVYKRAIEFIHSILISGIYWLVFIKATMFVAKQFIDRRLEAVEIVVVEIDE